MGPLLAQQKLSANDSKNHIGESATVCGSVVSTRYAASTKGQPTFLNLDKPYPNHVFTVLKRICVTGKITEYKGAPEIVVDDPGQIGAN